MPLPAPTRDIECALADLKTYGCCLMPEVLSHAQLAWAREAIYRAAEDDGRRARQQHGFGLDQDDGNLRVWNLLNRDPVFQEFGIMRLAKAETEV